MNMPSKLKKKPESLKKKELQDMKNFKKKKKRCKDNITRIIVKLNVSKEKLKKSIMKCNKFQEWWNMPQIKSSKN